jgi:hypothetical protein
MAGEEAQPKMTFHITRAALSGWGLDSLPARFMFLVTGCLDPVVKSFGCYIGCVRRIPGKVFGY